MTDADKAMNSQHFGSDPALADISTRIQINPEIRIRIPDHCRPWQKFALSKHGLVYCIFWRIVY